MRTVSHMSLIMPMMVEIVYTKSKGDTSPHTPNCRDGLLWTLNRSQEVIFKVLKVRRDIFGRIVLYYPNYINDVRTLGFGDKGLRIGVSCH